MRSRSSIKSALTRGKQGCCGGKPGWRASRRGCAWCVAVDSGFQSCVVECIVGSLNVDGPVGCGFAPKSPNHI